MKRYGEYTVQGILACLQSLVIIGGCLFTAVALKVRGYPDKFTELPLWLAFVRNWGFLLILIPLAWVCSTIWLERNRSDEFSKRWTIVTGIVVAVALGIFLFACISSAGSSLIKSE